MKLSPKKVLILLAMVLGLLPATVGATTITFPNRIAFAAGVLGEIVEGWDGLADGTMIPSIPSLGGITYQPSVGEAIVTSFFLPLSFEHTLGRTPDGFFLASDTMTFAFDLPITAFGISFNTFAEADGDYSATTNLGDVISSFYDPFPGFATGQFVGFSSDTPFNTVTLSSLTFESNTLDDLSYVPASVPEPATLILFGLGTAAVAYRRRRRT